MWKTGQASTPRWTRSRRNVSSNHRIDLRNAWKIQVIHTRDGSAVRAHRRFGRPTGIAPDQVVRFCIRPSLPDTTFFLNDESVGLVTLDGIATAEITLKLQNSNYAVLCWNRVSISTNDSEIQNAPVAFEAWLEIL
jgi:hypothetical protein